MTIPISDCEPGYHHPPGDLATCVPDAPPPQPVPAMDAWGVIALAAALSAAALVAGVRRPGWWR
jgi:hypothetical protein